MIKDEERREVARRLRKTIGLTEFAEALGFNWTDDSDWGWKDVSNLVADLIEPPTQCPYYRSDRHYCSAYDDVVDRDALLALADEMEGEKRDISCATCRADFGMACYDYKPNATCMEACLRYYARRIRDALGVER